MKAILPILICSAISAGLGYYFGHITVPEDLASNSSAPAAAPSSDSGFGAPASTANTAPSSVQVAEEPPAPAPAPAPTVAPEANAAAPVAATEPKVEPAATADSGADNYAERAAKTVHTLTDTQGRTINAKIVEVLDTQVKIRRTDGLETTIPLNMLREEDVAFCNYLREQQEAEAAKTPDTSDGFDWDAYFNS